MHGVLPPFHAADLIFGETVDHFKAVALADRKAHAVHQNDAVAVEFERFVHVDEHAPVAGQKPLVALQHRFQLGESLQAYQALDAAKTAEEVQPGLAEVYPTATVMDLNGTSVVAFHDADEDVLGIVVMDTVDPGYYIFMFTPASDANFLPVADAIAASYTAAQ